MNKIIANKLIALVLSLSMLISLVPSFSLTFTAETTEETIPTLNVPGELTPVNIDYTTAIIKNDAVTLYNDYSQGASGKSVNGVAGETITLWASYSYLGEVYLYSYYYDSTTNENLLDAYISDNPAEQYRYILASDISLSSDSGGSPDTTPTIPEIPTLTVGADVSIVDGSGAPVTESGFKIREGAKVSLSAWTGYTDVGDETYQWQISSQETAGSWVNINGQQSKGLLMSLAMVNSMTVPSIRCQIVTGGVTKYSTPIPVTALKEDTFTDVSSNVSVAGVLPIDATLSVANTTATATGLNNGVYPVGESSLFNDVTLYRGNSTYQPEDGETVTVTFPESSVIGTGFTYGDAYHVYHIHDGVVDLSEIRYYNGGNVEMTFSNLSVVGISEATPAEKDLVEQHGAIISEETLSPYQIMYIKNDSVDLYDTPESSESAHITTITGCIGAEVEAYEKFTYEDGFVVYRVSSTGNTPSDLSSTIGAYPIISASDLSGEITEEPDVINTCAICGQEIGTTCVTPHVYCPECKIFDCGFTHEKPVTEKPITSPVIPTNPTLTDGADVSIVDAEGNAITPETGIAIPEGTRISLSAWSDIEYNANVTYQWQIRYDGENWTDIQGKTEKGLVLSPAMVISIPNPAVRCVITSGDTVQYSDAIPVAVSASVATLSLDDISGPTMFNLARMSNGIATVADTYNIVINYVFENNEIVADPYTATLAPGSNFSATVKHPVVQGYLPYVGNATETSEKIDLNITNIQADVTYTVTYKPTNVNYTVIHYWQNIDDDDYTKHETETLQGLTGSEVPSVGKDYPGFYELLYEHPEIAADGSTVVEVYYDRTYYLMLFSLGEGGYGVEPIYDRFGAPIPDVGTPVRPGYTFNGWSLDGTTAIELPGTMPSEKRTYIALWSANDTAKVKVVIWGENPNDEEYSYLATGELMLTPNTKYTYNGTDQLYLYCDQEEHTHDDCDLTCGKEEHTQHTEACLGECIHPTHELACYSAGDYELVATSKPDQITSYPTEGIYTYTTTNYWGTTTTHYYLYIDETWYCAQSGGWGAGGDDTEITLNCTHTHTDECYTCETHAHTTACYGCGKEEHSHDSNCTGTVEGLNSTLWKFVRSDTVTVNPDGSSVINVYYDRTSFTMTFKETGYNGDTLDTITDKWGADIKTRFETISKANTFFWSATSNGGSPWTSFMDVMPAENRTYYADNQSGSTTITATYLGENLEGTGYETLYTVSFRGSSNITVTVEEFVDIEGFTFNDSLSSDVGDRYNGSKFYYDRHNYAIEFYSPTTLLKKTEGIPFESPLNSYDDWTPDASMAPSQYEPGSVVFEGWYLNPECTGDKFDFTTHTMPAGTNDGDTTLTLYAKWVSITHTVSFYLNKAALDADIKLSTHPDLTVSHGQKVTPVPSDPTNGSYTFVSWFYIDGDTEKAFDFANIPVNKDLKVYAKWSSNVLKEYIVYFKIQGTDTQIALPIKGSTLAGETKTFDAKGDEALYVDYREGYFPLVQSHSMTLDINTPETSGTYNGVEWVEITNDDGTKKIVQSFTFWYVQKDAVPYTVYYVAETLKAGEDAASYETITRDGKTYYIIADTYTNSENRKAVVTEKFKTVPGYMPDAYQKRLVVNGSEDAVNELIFYYSVDTEHAYYQITHYTQNTDGETWTVYGSPSQAQGDIGVTYTASPLTIDGFTYDSSIEGTVVSGVLTENGLELKLYYVRNEYPYEVRYLEQGTGKVLDEPKKATGLYGAVVGENAIDIDDYTAVAPTSQTLTIKIEESQTEAKLNIITFYYTENEVTINYVPVGPEGSGSVSLGSETVKVLTGVAQGSTAIPATPTFKFVGWYSDEACTKLLTTNSQYIPAKVNGKNVSATYYAKFEYNLTSLTITKAGWRGQSIDPNQTFIFVVRGKGADGNDMELEVTIHGNGSTTIDGLTVGETYTVTEKNDWSWRYSFDNAAIKTFNNGLSNGIDSGNFSSNKNTATATLKLGVKNNEIIVTNLCSNKLWLDGDSWCDNRFAGKSN